jgi:hypothetical protein
MAETKTRSGGSRSRTRSSNGSQSRPKRNGRSTQSSGAAKAGAAKEMAAVQEIASKAKAPAMAGGAVLLAGLAAGAAAISRNGRQGSFLSTLNRKRRSKATRKALGVTAKALGNTAVEVGKAGYRIGELSAEIRRVREQAAQKN